MSKQNHEPDAKRDREQDLDEALEMTFPASDPLASTEPGGGLTGPEVVERPKKRGGSIAPRLA